MVLRDNRKQFTALIVGGALMAVHSGFINACFLVEGLSMAVSYMTGTVARIGIAAVTNEYDRALWSFCLVSSFITGSLVTGFLVGTEKFKMRPAYGIVLMIESTLLILASVVLENTEKERFTDIKAWKYLYMLPALACGMQNAMCTTFSGAVIRTTHMTVRAHFERKRVSFHDLLSCIYNFSFLFDHKGISTDIGIIIGQYLRRHFGFSHKKDVEVWKLFVFIPLWIGFLVGGALGTVLIKSFGLEFYALLIPATTLGITGISIVVYYFAFTQPKIKKERHLQLQELNIQNEHIEQHRQQHKKHPSLHPPSQKHAPDSAEPYTRLDEEETPTTTARE
eukprot:TRINITY_DN3468_c0_g2_i2.p1 TRINITY_DN3468_c0_g2~~TRINITY_DN3468_c0_g2_i2.p1  ORF type:complete len:337 (+),score=70.94 TRINITY_DN3468_c0_g2_i2:370-1380(+)